jgi:hypothetical protein
MKYLLVTAIVLAFLFVIVFAVWYTRSPWCLLGLVVLPNLLKTVVIVVLYRDIEQS